MANLPQSYGLNPLINIFPAPIQSQRAPTANDLGYEPGQLWLDALAGTVYVLVSNSNGAANWTTSTPFGANPVVQTIEATAAGDAIFTSNAGGNIHSANDLIADNDLTVTGTATVGTLVINGIGANVISGASVEIEGTQNAADAVLIHATGAGGNSTIAITDDAGTASTAIGITSTVGGVTITAGLAAPNAVDINSTGGVDIDAALLISLTSTRNNAQAILLESTVGGIDILASGAGAGEDIDIAATGSSVNISASEAAADAVTITASDAAGAVVITGVGGVSVASTNAAIGITSGTGAISISDDAAATTLNVATGAAVKTINIGGIGANVLHIADTQTAGSVSIGAAMTTGTISVGGTGAQTGNVVLAPSTGAQTVTLANNNGAKTINVGSGISGNTISVGNGANSSAQVINLAAGASAANSTVNILSGNGSAGTQTANIVTGTRAGAVNIGSGAAAHQITIGNANAGNLTTLASPITALPGPVYIYTGAGAPANGLALHIGDLYIRTDAGAATERMYISTGVGAWTNVTCAA